MRIPTNKTAYTEKKRDGKRGLSLLLAVLLLTLSFAQIPAAANAQEPETFCGLDEHTHTRECYVKEQICTREASEAHSHTDACYTEQTALICGREEREAHAHTESCYAERELISCGREESAGHSHTDACYAEQQVLNCAEEHEHTDACYTAERVLNCGLAESEGHAHSEACFGKETYLACGLEETEGHSHTDACRATERVLSCGGEETEGHVHTDACFAMSDTPLCGLEEHTHTLECYSNRHADREYQAGWQRSVAGAVLTGHWAHDLIEVAQTQIGYNESEDNYVVVNGAKQGYTRYGAWYGNAYGEWCATFVSFCLHYAKIPTRIMPQEAYVPAWVKKLQGAGLFASAEDYTPQRGDLILFRDRTNDDLPNHVGIVFSVSDSAVTTIEGNSGPVNYHSYKLSDPTILGYGKMAENPNYVAPSYVEEIPATCDTDGVRAHYVSADGKSFFADAEGYEHLSAEELILPAAHSWEKTGSTRQDDQSAPTENRVCAVCGETSGEEAAEAPGKRPKKANDDEEDRAVRFDKGEGKR